MTRKTSKKQEEVRRKFKNGVKEYKKHKAEHPNSKAKISTFIKNAFK